MALPTPSSKQNTAHWLLRVRLRSSSSRHVYCATLHPNTASYRLQSPLQQRRPHMHGWAAWHRWNTGLSHLGEIPHVIMKGRRVEGSAIPMLFAIRAVPSITITMYLKFFIYLLECMIDSIWIILGVSAIVGISVVALVVWLNHWYHGYSPRLFSFMS